MSMTLTITSAVGAPGRGTRQGDAVSARDEQDAELTFGRDPACDLVISAPNDSAAYFSRTHGRFYFDGAGWRVRREGSSALLMWLDIGNPRAVTSHGLGSDLRLPVSEGAVVFRPHNTDQNVTMRWAWPDMPVVGEDTRGIGGNVTKLPPAVLGRPVEKFSRRFVVFLLVLCHRHLLKLDYTAPSIAELALWVSSKRGTPLRADTVRTEYLAKLRGILQNLDGSRTLAQRDRDTAMVRQHSELAVLAQDVMDMRIVDCDQLVACLRGGEIPNFPDLGWSGGCRG